MPLSLLHVLAVLFVSRSGASSLRSFPRLFSSGPVSCLKASAGKPEPLQVTNAQLSAAPEKQTPVRYLLADFIAGVAGAGAVTPFIALIDAAVTGKAANPSLPYIAIFRRHLDVLVADPMAFLAQPAVVLVFVVYSATYVVVNLISSVCDTASIDGYYFKIFGASSFNMGLGISKDRYFASIYGKHDGSSCFPLMSWMLFLLRDVLTVASGFNFPSSLSGFLVKNRIISSPNVADVLSQLIVPLGIQLLLTPVHLLALDLHNRPSRMLVERLRLVVSILPSSLAVRMARVLAAYGIAGLLNTNCRSYLRRRV